MDITYKIPYDGHTHSIPVAEPNQCPRCKHSVKPSILHKELFKTENKTFLLCVVYFCNNCYSPFICEYSDLIQGTNFSSNYKFNSCRLSLIAPKIFENHTFSNDIQQLSPDFINIYNQALQAEHLQLDQISGIGYRKALEFLIKDFLIKHQGKDALKVNSTALGLCIDTMIDNPQLKIAASRATWLGNDQTHYEQRYSDKDITDLKRLIDLSVHWISMIYLTEEAELIEKK